MTHDWRRYANNPARWVAFRAQRAPDSAAFSAWEGETITYGSLHERATATAAELAAHGITRGTRVAFVGENETALLVLSLATWRLGATFVPLNYRMPAAELRPILANADVQVLVAGTGYASVLDLLDADLGGASTFTIEPGPLRLVSGAPDDAAVQFSDNRDDDVAAILYTSGTTGVPKGVTWTYANIWWAATAFVASTGTTDSDVNLVMGPMVLAGPMFMLLASWATGGRIVSMQRFEPAQALAAIRHHRVTVGATSPLILQMLADDPGFGDADLSSVRYLVVGGGPITTALLARFVERSIRLTQGYAMSETTAVATYLHPDAMAAKLGSSGLPIPMVDVRVVASDGSLLPAGEVGEIHVRGPNVTPGYWRRPDETATAIDPDGWLHTGDAGRFDADGHLYVVDRIKDMIISGGLNVYAAEVERVLIGHPGVAEVAVIGVPDDHYGELVTAVVIAAPGRTIVLDELREAARPHLAGYKLPRRLDVVEELPRNASGKVLKRELRKAATEPVRRPGPARPGHVQPGHTGR